MSNKERIDAVTEQLKSMQAKVFQKSQGENGEYYKSLLDGTLTEFSAPKAGVTTLAPYRFYKFANLKKADFTGVTEIPDNICQNCNSLQELVIDPNTTNIGNNAFNEANISGDLILKDCYIGNNAFRYTKINNISGSVTYIGTTAFASDTIKSIKLKINGKIFNSGFAGIYNINEFILDKESNITNLDSQSFINFGINRENPETNIFVFDFRKSTFTKIISSTFTCITVGSTNKYFDIYFPETMTNITNYNFEDTDHFNIFYKTVPTLSNVNNFTSATNFKNFFPYNRVKDAKVATNWSSTTNGIVDSIYGWAEENTFTQGQTLPTTDSAGNTLTWYSDVDLTTQVTTAENPEQIYYCTWTDSTIPIPQ